MKQENIIKKLSQNCFTWDKCGIHLGLALDEVIDERNNLKTGFEIVGYIQAKDLIIRPRTSVFDLAVMFMNEQNGEEFWLHIYLGSLRQIAQNNNLKIEEL